MKQFIGQLIILGLLLIGVLPGIHDYILHRPSDGTRDASRETPATRTDPGTANPDAGRAGDQTSRQKAALTLRLHGAIGYGGLIHQFKNYVLRQDPETKEKIRSAIKDVQATIARMQSLSLSEDEMVALEKIVQAVKAYEDNLDVIATLSRDGLSPTQIDEMIAVNDQPALDGLKTLETKALAQTTSGARDAAR